MGFDEKSGFHSGHTQALDLDDLDKQADKDGWNPEKSDWHKDSGKKSDWASDDWGSAGGGGGGEWDEWGGNPGGKGNTMALDIESLRDDGMKPQTGSSSRRSNDDDWDSGGNDNDWGAQKRSSGGGGWGNEWDDGDADDDWGGGGGGDGPRTMALDIEDLTEPPKERRRRREERERENKSKNSEIRYEDSRSEGREEARRGAKSYDPGANRKQHSYNPGEKRAKEAPKNLALTVNDDDAAGNKRSSAPPSTNKKKAPPSTSSARHGQHGGATPAGELKPHERTMALDVESMARGAAAELQKSPAAPSQNDLPRTQALDIDELMRGSAAGPPSPASSSRSPAELAPHERTHALDLNALKAGLPSTQAMAPVSGPASAKPSPAMDVPVTGKTTMLDTIDLEAMRLNEASSGGRLLIFVEGADPVVFDLRPGITNIGRDRANHLVLSDPFSSRKHLRIKKHPGGHFELKDQGSDNRTLINGQPGGEKRLEHGDDIQVGSTVMRFCIGEPTDEDWVWPIVAPPPTGMPPRSGNTAAVRPIEDDVMLVGNEGNAKKPSKTLMIVLALVIVGTIVMAGLVVVFFLWGDAIFG